MDPLRDTETSGRRVSPLLLAYAGLFAVLIGGAVAITMFGDSHRASPMVVGDLAPFKPANTVQPKSVAPEKPQAALPAITEPILAGHALIADPKLIETTPQGPLPRIAADGTTPMRAYAPAFTAGKQPRIAIVISGLGISPKATDAALAQLPAGVTLGFSASDPDAQRQISQARQQGHEVLLALPMEPYDYPDSDPGPNTLRAGVSPEGNAPKLALLLTRVTGYAGVTNLQGGRLLGDAASLEPLMSYVAQRGLLFFDDGSAAHSVAPDVAARVGGPFLQADSAIDTILTPNEIDHRLAALETLARSRGSATGTGFVYPATLDRVSAWAKGLTARGFVLAPASAIVPPSK